MQKQISAIISLKDRFSGPLLKMSKNIESLDKETRSSMNRVNRWGKQVEKSVDRAVKATAKWAKRGAVLATGWSLKSGFEGTKELDYAARKVKSIAGERLDFSDIMQDIKDFSFEFGKTYEEIGDGFYNAISASIPMDLLNQAVELGNQLSIAGFTDMDSSISLMASTMNAFDMKTSEQMQNMADQFLLTQNLGVITVDEMAQYYGRISTLSGQIGASLEEQNAAMATMTMRGMTQREATTSYRSILNAFLKNTSESQQAAIEAMGLSSDFLTAKTFDSLGFDGVVEEIAKAAKGDLDLISEIFPDVRGKIGAIMFGPDSGMDDFKRILAELESPEGVLDDAHAELNNSVERQWEIFKQRIKTLNDELYTEEDGIGGYLVEQLRMANDWLDDNRDDLITKINDTSKKIIEGVKGIFDFYNEHEDTIKKIGKTLAGMYVFTKVVGWIGAFTGAVSSVIDVLGGLLAGDIVGGGFFSGVISSVFGSLVKWAPIVGQVVGGMALAFLKLAGGATLLVGGIWAVVIAVKAAWKAIKERDPSAFMESIRKDTGFAIDTITGKWDGLKDTFSSKLKPDVEFPNLEPYRKELGITTEKSNEFNLLLDKPYLSTPEFINQRFNKDIEETTDLATGLNDFINQHNPFSLEAILEGHTTFRERTNEIISDWQEQKSEFENPLIARVNMQGGVTGGFESIQKPIDEALDHILQGDYKSVHALKNEWGELKDELEEDINVAVPNLSPYKEEFSLAAGKVDEFNTLLEKPKVGTAEFKGQEFNKNIKDSTNFATRLSNFIGQFSPFTAEAVLKGHTTFRERSKAIRKEWSKTRDHLSTPIVGRATILMNRQERKSQAEEFVKDWSLGTNYKGTSSWKGGLTHIHERGGEIMDLPGGTRIYPHDESVKIARSEGAATVTAAGIGGQNISVNLGGVSFSGDFNTEVDINEIGTKIVNTIKKELKNI